MSGWQQIEGEAPELVAGARRMFDARFALHSASDGESFQGDAKVAGRVEEVTSDEVKQAVVGGGGPSGPMHLFRADITELVVISLGGDPPDHMVIESWHPGRGVTTRKR